MIQEIEKTREYLNYLEEHYNNVQKAWEVIKEKCKDMWFIIDDFRYFSILEAVESHDLSKMSANEFIQYRKKFFPTDYEANYEPAKKEIDTEFKKAWENHKKKNPHHYQNWKEIKGAHGVEVHIVHNIIDWMAIGYKFNDTAKDYYEKNKEEINIPSDWVDFVYDVFDKVYK